MPVLKIAGYESANVAWNEKLKMNGPEKWADQPGEDGQTNCVAIGCVELSTKATRNF
jgi:hypothetical protein